MDESIGAMRIFEREEIEDHEARLKILRDRICPPGRQAQLAAPQELLQIAFSILNKWKRATQERDHYFNAALVLTKERTEIVGGTFDDIRCPRRGRFGWDCMQFDECADCPANIFDACAFEAQMLAEQLNEDA